MQINSLPAGGADGAGEIEVSPVRLYTKQRSAHKRCFIRHYMQDEMKMTSIIFWRQSVSFRNTEIHLHQVSILNLAVLMFIQRSQSLLENLFVAVSFDIVVGATNKSMYEKHCSLIIEV